MDDVLDSLREGNIRYGAVEEALESAVDDVSLKAVIDAIKDGLAVWIRRTEASMEKSSDLRARALIERAHDHYTGVFWALEKGESVLYRTPASGSRGIGVRIPETMQENTAKFRRSE